MIDAIQTLIAQVASRFSGNSPTECDKLAQVICNGVLRQRYIRMFYRTAVSEQISWNKLIPSAASSLYISQATCDRYQIETCGRARWKAHSQQHHPSSEWPMLRHIWLVSPMSSPCRAGRSRWDIQRITQSHLETAIEAVPPSFGQTAQEY